jgi:hypothetical protein
MLKQITISSDGAFEEVEIEQSDEVFWVNNDSKPHWPVPWCYGLRVDPSTTSNTFQIFPGASPNLPQQVRYQDALTGQTGVILVYNDFQLVASPYTARKASIVTIPLAQGGKSPYDTSSSIGVPSWVEFAESTPGSSAGFGAVLTDPPTGRFTFDLNATDALGKNIQQQITIEVTPAAEARGQNNA